MAPGLGENPIDIATFGDIEVTIRSAGRDRLARKRTRSDAEPGELADPRLGLLRLGFIGADQAFDAFIKTWAGSPTRVELTNASDCVERSGLRERKTS